ncbi:MAG: glycosyltransferase, partial [Methanobrevibacter sp.]|nr:glycosyltransferase [Methanobrevibacter sp.]
MEPKISIIIPTYNAEKYLEKAINSVIKQTIGFE